MGTISIRRLSDKTLAKYKAILENGGELTPRQQRALYKHNLIADTAWVELFLRGESLAEWHHDYRAQFCGNHLAIERHDGAPVVCDWDTLQAIKNEMTGDPELCFVEFFPPQSEVVDEVNRRHFWLVDNDLFEQFNLNRRG